MRTGVDLVTQDARCVRITTASFTAHQPRSRAGALRWAILPTSLHVDWAHDHGQGRPHVHDWGRDQNGNPSRGEGRPATDDEKFSEPARDPDTGRIDRDD